MFISKKEFSQIAFKLICLNWLLAEAAEEVEKIRNMLDKYLEEGKILSKDQDKIMDEYNERCLESIRKIEKG